MQTFTRTKKSEKWLSSIIKYLGRHTDYLLPTDSRWVAWWCFVISCLLGRCVHDELVQIEVVGLLYSCGVCYHHRTGYHALICILTASFLCCRAHKRHVLFLVIIIHYPSVRYWQCWIYSVIYYTLKDGLIIVMFILTMISIYFSTLLKSWRLECGHVYYV